jgi:putative zinc finger/helix-turn-helix YgiT family protein
MKDFKKTRKLCPTCGGKMTKTKEDYRYKECGLDNVILSDLTVYRCNCGEEMPAIPNMEGIHKVIGLETIQSKTVLSGKQIRFLRKEMGLMATELADILGANKVTVSRWESGEEPIGHANDKLVRVLYLRRMDEDFKKVIKLNTEIGPILERITYETKKAVQIKIPIGKTGALQPSYY